MKIDIDKQLQVLKPEKKNLVLAAFAPIVQKLNELGESYPEIQEMKQTPERSDKAKRFRIDLKKAINTADVKRKDLKDESLQEGRAIQGVFNHIKNITSGTVDEAVSIERFYINFELAEKAELKRERELELEKYEMDGTSLNLGEMESTIWANFLLGAKRGYEEKQQLEKEEVERIIEEKRIRELHQDRKDSIINLWQFMPDEEKNSNFGTWENKTWLKLGRFLSIEKSNYDLEQEKIKQDNEKLRAENEKAESKRIADKKRSDNKLKKEREENQKVEDARQKAEADEKRRLTNAPDKVKLTAIANYLAEQVETVSTVEAEDIIKQARDLVINFACKM
jgi:hypothetical protein